ncbi:MAG: hypothetical protein ABSB78_14285 [Bacteroidota bacterium]
MATRKPRYFLLTYYDDDSSTFNVIGPISDDEAVTQRTVELQKEGRHVRVSTSEPMTDPVKVPSIQSYLRNAPTGFRYDPSLRW